MEALFQARLIACPDLPTLPAVALRVLELCRSDDKDLDAIGRVVEGDPAIAAKLLRLANSASLAVRGKVTTLSRAIAIVGTNATLSTVLSFSLVRSRRADDTTGFDHARFWRRAVFCGVAARTLGEILGVDPEEAFLAGLLQDLGMLALSRVFPADYGQIWLSAEGDHGRLTALEREVLGADHLEAGLVLARRWNLPEAFCGAIQGSHAPADSGLEHRLAEVAFLSGPLADVWIGPASAERLERAVATARDRFGGSAGHVATALSRMALALPEAASDFDIDLGGRLLVDAVESQARDLLRERGLAPDAPEHAGALRMPEPGPAIEAAFREVRARVRGLAILVVAPVQPTAPLDVPALVTGCLRRTDVVAVRAGASLALLYDPAPGGSEVVCARIRQRAAVLGWPVAIGWAELRPEVACASAAELLASAERALEASRARGGVPIQARHAVAGPRAGDEAEPGGQPGSAPC